MPLATYKFRMAAYRFLNNVIPLGSVTLNPISLIADAALAPGVPG